jgi:hypothetical protein
MEDSDAAIKAAEAATTRKCTLAWQPQAREIFKSCDAFALGILVANAEAAIIFLIYINELRFCHTGQRSGKSKSLLKNVRRFTSASPTLKRNMNYRALN